MTSETEKLAIEEPKDTMSFGQIGRVDGKRLLIEKEVVLKGCVCFIPDGLTLC